MSDNILINQSEELIDIPSFLSTNNYGISLAASDCGICQINTMTCGTSQDGGCSICEANLACASTCQTSGQGCTAACEKAAQGCTSTCEKVTQGSQKVTCTKTSKFYKNGNLVTSSTETEGNLTPGLTFTPSLHMPSYDSNVYYLVSITYNGTNVTNSSITCPSSNFTCVYTFYAIKTITPWSWSASNGSASNTQTAEAYSAIIKKEPVSNFSYLVWNDLVDKVIEMRKGAGKSDWSTSNSDGTNIYISSSATKMTSTDKTLTAKRFNALRWNIGTVVSTDITDKNPGDEVKGSYFIALAEKLNEAINTMT